MWQGEIINPMLEHFAIINAFFCCCFRRNAISVVHKRELTGPRLKKYSFWEFNFPLLVLRVVLGRERTQHTVSDSEKEAFVETSETRGSFDRGETHKTWTSWNKNNETTTFFIAMAKREKTKDHNWWNFAHKFFWFWGQRTSINKQRKAIKLCSKNFLSKKDRWRSFSAFCALNFHLFLVTHLNTRLDFCDSLIWLHFPFLASLDCLIEFMTKKSSTRRRLDICELLRKRNFRFFFCFAIVKLYSIIVKWRVRLNGRENFYWLRFSFC